MNTGPNEKCVPLPRYNPQMTDLWEKRFNRIRISSWLAVVGLIFTFAATVTSGFLQISMAIVSGALCAPAFLYLYVVVILHWKERYRGKHSDLWGILILIEVSGWMKLVYIFRHVNPDMRHSGRYAASLPQFDDLKIDDLKSEL